METVVDLPTNPYFCTLNFQPGEQIKITATVPQDAERLNIVFKCDEGPTSDIGLFLAIDFIIDEVVVTSKVSNGWGKINKYYGLCFSRRPDLEIEIQCTHSIYKLSVNGAKIDDYLHEVPWYNITHMAVSGDIDIKTITYLPVKQLIPTGETPPPDYEMAVRSDYGALNIPVVFKKDNEILTMYPTLIPLVPVPSETRVPPEIGRSSNNSAVLVANNAIQIKARNNCVIGISIVLMVLVMFYCLYLKFSPEFYDDEPDHTSTS